jgi:peptidoglycan/xylan/chitin deacetylase (PgdA/CDA1 family)
LLAIRIEKMVKAILKRILSNCLTTRLIETANRDRLRIICYHRIAGEGAFFNAYNPSLFVDEAEFDSQMRALSRYYNPVGEDEVIATLEGPKKLSPYSVWITFDDGYRDNFTLASPILKKYGIPATFFVTTDYINKKSFPYELYFFDAVAKTETKNFKVRINGRTRVFDLGRPEQRRASAQKIAEVLKKGDLWTHEHVLDVIGELKVNMDDIRIPFMSWQEIGEMSRNGFAIGAHTVSHKALSSLSSREVSAEIIDSKKEIEARISRPVFSFAYPYGKKEHYVAAVSRAALSEAGIRLAVTTEPGLNRLLKAQRYELKRFSVAHGDSTGVFRFKVASGCFWHKWAKTTY